jgi:hypothetical protein
MKYPTRRNPEHRFPLSEIRNIFYQLLEITNAEQDLDLPDWVDPVNPHTQKWDAYYQGYHIIFQFFEPNATRDGSLSISIPPMDQHDIVEMVYGKQASIGIYPQADSDKDYRGIVIARTVNRRQDIQYYYHYPEWVYDAQAILDELINIYRSLIPL